MATYSFTVDGEQYAYEVSDAAWGFFEACEHDSALNVQATGLKTIDEVAQLAQGRGFETSSYDIFQYGNIVAIEQRARQHAGELTDDELDLVAGGAGTGRPPTQPCRGLDCARCCTSNSKYCSSCYCTKNCA